MVVNSCPVGALHTFQVRTLRSLGYATRVVLANKSHLRADACTDYRVDVSIYASGAGRTDVFEDLGTLAPDARLVIDCTRFEIGKPDVTLVFHLIPRRFVGQTTVHVDRNELMFLGSVQDHFVEYYRTDGCSAGVLYQTGPFNVGTATSTTLIQAPKYYVSNSLDSLLSLVNGSADPSYARTAQLRCTLVGDDGTWSWSQDIPAFVPTTISMRDELVRRGVELSDEPRFTCFFGLCDNATLVPLTILHNTNTGVIGIEHSLPPDYYAPVIRGAGRAKLVDALRTSRWFGSGGRL